MSFLYELNKITEKRQAVFSFDLSIISLILLGGISWPYVPVLSIFFAIIALVLFYKKLAVAAQCLCPKCKAQFSTKVAILTGVGANECQNCKLSSDQ